MLPVTNTNVTSYQYVWNQQPSNYSHPKQKPQSPYSRIASDAGRVLEEEDHCTPGRSASNLLSYGSIQSAEHRLDDRAAATNRRNVCRTQQAETQSDGAICSKLESCGLTLLWIGNSQCVRRTSPGLNG
jgi:hypothetical protein